MEKKAAAWFESDTGVWAQRDAWRGDRAAASPRRAALRRIMGFRLGPGAWGGGLVGIAPGGGTTETHPRGVRGTWGGGSRGTKNRGPEILCMAGLGGIARDLALNKYLIEGI